MCSGLSISSCINRILGVIDNHVLTRPQGGGISCFSFTRLRGCALSWTEQPDDYKFSSDQVGEIGKFFADGIFQYFRLLSHVYQFEQPLQQTDLSLLVGLALELSVQHFPVARVQLIAPSHA